MLLAAQIAIIILAFIVFTVIHIINKSYHLGVIPYMLLLAFGIYGIRWLWSITKRIGRNNKQDAIVNLDIINKK